MNTRIRSEPNDPCHRGASSDVCMADSFRALHTRSGVLIVSVRRQSG